MGASGESSKIVSTLLAIDPGIRGCGAALFKNEKLISAAYVVNSVAAGSGPHECAQAARSVVEWVEWSLLAIDHPVAPGRKRHQSLGCLVLEWPQTYSGRSSRGDTNKLFPLSGVDGALAA